MNIPISRPSKVNTRDLHPIDIKFTTAQQQRLSQKTEFFGKTPNIFVGRYGYPSINVGLLGVEEYYHHDEPVHWKAQGYGIQNILDLRTTLINSGFRAPVSSASSAASTSLLDLCQEVAMASKPVDVEVRLQKAPVFRATLSSHHLPHGPRVELKKAVLAENPSIPTKVDKLVSDTDAKAGDAMLELVQHGIDTHYLVRLLSAGTLGVKPERKLVPTRWSITAVDDTLGKSAIEDIKDYQQLGPTAYFGGYQGNYYLVLFFPGVWGYELFETLASAQGNYSTDHEGYDGRKNYASSTVGGYYAARLAILEKLQALHRQASCLCLRFITKEYWAPLGVWVVREAVRNAMQATPIEFSDKELMLTYVRHLVQKKFGYDVDILLKESKLLKAMAVQRKLDGYW